MFLRKSAIEEYFWCPYKFKRTYIDGVPNQPNWKMLIGTRFHEFSYWFFDHCGAFPVEQWQELVPSSFNDDEQRMTAWFIKQEVERYDHLDGNMDLFLPAFRELQLIDSTRQLTGTADRGDWRTSDKSEITIVEYKTGSSFHRPSLVRQLAFYTLIANTTMFNGMITGMKYINPRTEEIRDIPMKDKYTDDVLNAIFKVRQAIKNNDFPRKCFWGKPAFCGVCSPEECGAYGPEDP